MVSERMRARASDRRQKDIGGQEATPGYAVNGTSEWERHAAGGSSVDTQTDTRTKERQEWSRLDKMVQHERKEVEKILRGIERAKVEDPERVPFKIKRLQRTRFLLARLEAEQRAAS